jgi:hypothetical protein
LAGEWRRGHNDVDAERATRAAEQELVLRCKIAGKLIRYFKEN